MKFGSEMSEGDTSRAVLIVDDDPNFAESLADILAARGCRVHLAGTAAGAVRMLRDGGDGADAVDVALVDVRLGIAASGVDLLSRLKGDRPDLVCVTMTATLDTQ